MTREEYVFSLRQKYTKGVKLKLLASVDKDLMEQHMNDIMIVDHVDDMGQIHGTWQKGGSLALNPIEDIVVIER